MKNAVSFFLAYSSLVQAIPLRSHSQHERNIPNPNVHVTIGEPATDRTIFTTISLVWLMVLSLLLGLRFAKLKQGILLNQNLVSLLVLIMYLLVFGFLIVSNVLVAGQGLYTPELCLVATWTCLLLYTFIKFLIYVFLVERIHVVRAPIAKRRHDKIYLSCMAMIVVLYSCVAINAYVNHVTEFRPSTGRCHFGIHTAVSIPFTAVNLFVATVLTSVFFYLIRHVVRKPGTSTFIGQGAHAHVHHGASDTPLRKNLRALLRKSLIGGLLIEIPTAANMIQFVIIKGGTLSMICLTICVVEVCWDVLVMHWLLFGSSGSTAEKSTMETTNHTGESLSTCGTTKSNTRLWRLERPRLFSHNTTVWATRDRRTRTPDLFEDEQRSSVSGLIRPAPARL